MKKIFIITGEPSGDKLASEVIKKIKKDRTDVEYLCVGGNYLNSIGIKSIFDQKEITYIAFTDILFNLFKIKKKINETVSKILDFNPDILFSVDSPDFTLRVSKIVKNKKPNIKTIHFIAPKVWAWRKGRVKKMKKYLDHILLLFDFEKKFFDEENINNTFVGHPLIENNKNNKTDINNFISNNKKIISIFPGSRKSETNVLLPILIDFINMMNKRNSNYNFIFHATEENKNNIIEYIKDKGLNNIDVISDENMKKEILSNSIFAVCKSGTISLQVCNANVPSIIIYKLNFINFMIFKLLVNVKFANIINIINNKEVIPELLQSECNAKEIYNSVLYMLKNPEIGKKQLEQCNQTLKGIRSNSSSSNEVATILRNSLVG